MAPCSWNWIASKPPRHFMNDWMNDSKVSFLWMSSSYATVTRGEESGISFFCTSHSFTRLTVRHGEIISYFGNLITRSDAFLFFPCPVCGASWDELFSDVESSLWSYESVIAASRDQFQCAGWRRRVTLGLWPLLQLWLQNLTHFLDVLQLLESVASVHKCQKLFFFFL